MKRSIFPGLLTFLVLGCSPDLAALTPPPPTTPKASPTPAPASSQRDVFYFDHRFGFRLVSPQGYVITPSETPLSQQPGQPLQVLEIWKRQDFQNRTNLPETPPLIQISVYNNTRKLPLTAFKGELSLPEQRPTTVAGQPAIAYRSTGLYETDNVLFSSPDRRYVFRVQGGYMKADDAIRQVFQQVVSSFTFDLLPKTSGAKPTQINYNRLRSLLKAGNWQAADVETRAILQRFQTLNQGTDYLFDSDALLGRIPCSDIRTLDSLWSEASQGRFGYSAQQRIWQQTGSSTNWRVRVDRFGQAVGWRNPQSAHSSWRSDVELNHSGNAPVGQYPWVGVSSSLLSDIEQESAMGCGVCSVDAMYLRTDRYYHYLPALFSRVNQCRR